MANTENDDGKFVHISNIDEDYDMGEETPIEFISFQAVADTDRCVVKNGSATGPPVFFYDAGTAPETYTIYFRGSKFQPFLDFSDGSYAAGSGVIIARAEFMS